MRTIAKFRIFVICVSVGIAIACGGTKKERRAVENPNFDPPRVIGRITDKDIPESSGLAISACQTGVIWTHNDSGDGPFIFALDMTGKHLATYKVENAKNKDWEDIAAHKDPSGKCFIYIGEIGDNDLKREPTVYRIAEPQVPADGSKSDTKEPLQTAPAESLHFKYPDHDHNAETLMVHPVSGDIYVLSKEKSEPSSVFKLKPIFDSSDLQTAEKVGELKVPSIPFGLLTGGDIAPDGKHAIICDYTMGYELTLPDSESNFDAIWAQPPTPVDLGKRDHGESIAYNIDGSALIAGSEGENEPLFQIDRKK